VNRGESNSVEGKEKPRAKSIGALSNLGKTQNVGSVVRNPKNCVGGGLVNQTRT